MNRSRINSQGAKPLIDLIADYHSWNVTGNGTWREESWNFTTAMIDMQRKWYASPFLFISTGADYYNSTVNVIEVSECTMIEIFLFKCSSKMLEMKNMTETYAIKFVTIKQTTSRILPHIMLISCQQKKTTRWRLENQQNFLNEKTATLLVALSLRGIKTQQKYSHQLFTGQKIEF